MNEPHPSGEALIYFYCHNWYYLKNNVYLYPNLLNQEERHHKKTFREEYIDMLKKSRIDFDEKYLFDWFGMKQKYIGASPLGYGLFISSPDVSRRATDI